MAYHNENDASFASFALSASTLGIGAWGIHRYYPRIKYHWFPEGMVEKLQEMKVLDDKYNLPWARRTPMSPIDVIRKKRRDHLLAHLPGDREDVFTRTESMKAALVAREQAEKNLENYRRRDIRDIVRFFRDEGIGSNQWRSIYDKARTEFQERYGTAGMEHERVTMSNPDYVQIVHKHMRRAQRAYQNEVNSMRRLNVGVTFDLEPTASASQLRTGATPSIAPNSTQIRNKVFDKVLDTVYPDVDTFGVETEFRTMRAQSFNLGGGKHLEVMMDKSNWSSKIREIMQSAQKSPVLDPSIDSIKAGDQIIATHASSGVKLLLKKFARHLGSSSTAGRLTHMEARMIGVGDGLHAIEITLESRSGHRISFNVGIPRKGTVKRAMGETPTIVGAGKLVSLPHLKHDVFIDYMTQMHYGARQFSEGNVNRIVHELEMGNVARAEQIAREASRPVGGVLQNTDLDREIKGYNVEIESMSRAEKRLPKKRLTEATRGAEMMLKIAGSVKKGKTTFTTVDIETGVAESEKNVIWQVSANKWQYDERTKRWKVTGTKNYFVREGVERVSDAALGFSIHSNEKISTTRERLRANSTPAAVLSKELDNFIEGRVVVHGYDIEQKLLHRFPALEKYATAGTLVNTLQLSRADIAPPLAASLVDLAGLRGISERSIRRLAARIARDHPILRGMGAHNAVYDATVTGLVYASILKELDNPAMVDKLEAEIRRKAPFTGVSELIDIYRKEVVPYLSGDRKAYIIKTLGMALDEDNLDAVPFQLYGTMSSTNRLTKGHFNLRNIDIIKPFGALNNAGGKIYQDTNRLEYTPAAIKTSYRRRKGVGRIAPMLSTDAALDQMSKSTPDYFNRYESPATVAFMDHPQFREGAGLFYHNFLPQIQTIEKGMGMRVHLTELGTDVYHARLSPMLRDLYDMRQTLETKSKLSGDALQKALRNYALKKQFYMRKGDAVLTHRQLGEDGIRRYHGESFTPTYIEYAGGTLTIRGERILDGGAETKTKIGGRTVFCVDSEPGKYMPMVLDPKGTAVMGGRYRGVPVDIVAGENLIKKGHFGFWAEGKINMMIHNLVKSNQDEKLLELQEELGLVRVENVTKIHGEQIRSPLLRFAPGMTKEQIVQRLHKFFGGGSPEAIMKKFQQYNYVYTPMNTPRGIPEQLVREYLEDLGILAKGSNENIYGQGKLVDTLLFQERGFDRMVWHTAQLFKTTVGTLPPLRGLGTLQSDQQARTFRGQYTGGLRVRAADLLKLETVRFGPGAVGMPVLSANLTASMHLSAKGAQEYLNILKSYYFADQVNKYLPGYTVRKATDPNIRWNLEPLDREVAQKLSAEGRIFEWKGIGGIGRREFIENVMREYSLQNPREWGIFLDQNPDLLKVLRSESFQESMERATANYLVSPRTFQEVDVENPARKHVFSKEMTQKPWMLELPGVVTINGKPVSQLYIPGENQLAMWYHGDRNLYFKSQIHSILTNILDEAHALEIRKARGEDLSAKDLRRLGSSVQAFVNHSIDQMNKGGILGDGLTAHIPGLGRTFSRLYITPSYPEPDNWKDLERYSEEPVFPSDTKPPFKKAGGLSKIKKATPIGESYITIQQGEKFKQSFIEIWGVDKGLRRHEAFMRRGAAFFGTALVHPAMPGDYHPFVKVTKIRVNREIGKNLKYANIIMMNHYDIATMARDVDTDIINIINPQSLDEYEEMKKIWSAQYNPKTGWEMKKYRNITVKLKAALDDPGKLEKFLKDPLHSKLVFPDPWRRGFWVPNPDTGRVHLILPKSGGSHRVVTPKSSDYHHFFKNVVPNTRKSKAHLHRQIRRIEESIYGKKGIGEIHSAMTKLQLAADVAYGPMLSSGKGVKRMELFERGLSKLEQEIIDAKNLRGEVFQNHAEAMTDLITNLKRLTPDMIKTTHQARAAGSYISPNPYTHLEKHYSSLFEIPAFHSTFKRFALVMADLNKGKYEQQTQAEYLLMHARPDTVRDRGRDEVSRVIEDMLMGRTQDTRTSRLIHTIFDMGASPFAGGIPTPPVSEVQSDIYSLVGRRNIRTSLADMTEKFIGRDVRVAAEGMGTRAMKLGVKAGAYASFGWLALNFFKQNQVKILGQMPGEGGEKYDYKFTNAELPGHMPINIPSYSWDHCVRLDLPNAANAHKESKVAQMLADHIGQGVSFLSPRANIYPVVPNIHRNYQQMRNRRFIEREIEKAGGVLI